MWALLLQIWMLSLQGLELALRPAGCGYTQLSMLPFLETEILFAFNSAALSRAFLLVPLSYSTGHKLYKAVSAAKESRYDFPGGVPPKRGT
jgi:hypothetical protein